MGSQIEEFLAKKKEQTTLLDLHNCTANSKEELRKLVEKVPEFKIKPEKKLDDIKIKEKKFKFKLPKKEIKKPFPFAEPTPSEMKGVSLEELYSVNQNIPWKMLTSLRPKSKIDEEYFSRQIELGTATLKTRNEEKRSAPRDGYLRKRKNASGGVDAKFPSCKECGVEFCTGDGCNAFDYDSFKRRVATSVTLNATSGGDHAQLGGQEHAETPATKKTKKKTAAAAAGGRDAVSQRTKATAAVTKSTATARTGNDRYGTGGGGGKNALIAGKTPVKNNKSQPPASQPIKPKTGNAAATRKTAGDRRTGVKKPLDNK